MQLIFSLIRDDEAPARISVFTLAQLQLYKINIPMEIIDIVKYKIGGVNAFDRIGSLGVRSKMIFNDLHKLLKMIYKYKTE